MLSFAGTFTNGMKNPAADQGSGVYFQIVEK
jgi:hypothetical protein